MILNKETISAFKDGQIIGIPFPVTRGFTFTSVKKMWGEPERVIDNEDIHDYVYTKKGRKIIFTEDELKTIYDTIVEVKIGKESLFHQMGKPSEQSKKGGTLYYDEGQYIAMFHHETKDLWTLILRKKMN
ncbi:YjgB family protein [Fictibacillus sp. KIGAM418]|uniref:YjgB family protein n=1 Tax=Fictibacillus marinisediminis TaxID=2878389 RepID=A0A9X1X936_9BACL|nr:YjgB family protein [Fictibacillus marinisediminis]MCK6256462.1 YjgB family protein [Fictibacillus marinisediminis]